MKRTAELTRTGFKRPKHTQHGAFLRMAPKAASASVEPVMRKCKVCRQPFQVFRSLQKICDGHECATVMVERAQAKAARINARADAADTRAKKEATKSRPKLLAEAKVATQAFRRLEELAKGRGCMSCGRSQEEVMAGEGWKPGGAWDGGHFISKGTSPELALEPLNVWLQCKSCNAGSGKYARKGYTVNKSFEANLIEAEGQALVDWLKGPHEPKKYAADQLRAIRDERRAMARELKKRIEGKA